MDASAPWSVEASVPVIEFRDNIASQTRGERCETVSQVVCQGWLSFYQRVLSVVTVSQCVMEPSCSAYSMLAVGKHGAVVGVIMTADRLLHEGDEQKTARLAELDRGWRIYDSVENNDFWWGRRGQ